MTSAGNANALRLGDYARMLRRHWLVVLLCLVLGLGGALAYLHWAPKKYQATTGVLVTATPDGSANAAPRASDINLDTEAQLVTATDTLGAAASALHLSPAAASTLANSVAVSVPPNTQILDITYTASTPDAAHAGSLAFAQAYLDQRAKTATATLAAADKALQARIDAATAQLQSVLKASATLPANSPARFRNDAQASALNNQLAALGSEQTGVRSTDVLPGRIVSAPAVPTSPSSPKSLLTLLAGVVLGLLAGAGLAMLRHRADDVIRTAEDLFRRTRVPVATVLSGRLHAGQVSLLPPLSSDGRGYARLRNLVTTGLMQAGRPVVVVAGVRHGGGPVAANLAVSLARAGEEVFLVCADVFGGTTTALLGSAPRAGLGEVLAGEIDATTAAVTVPGIPNLRVLGAGRDPDRADALLQTRGPRKLIEELLATASYVVIEAPATADSPDAQTLANVAELAVIVVELGQTGAGEVLDACAQFESMGTPVLGAVVARYGKDAKVDDLDDVETDAETETDAEVEADRGEADGGEAATVVTESVPVRPAVPAPAETAPAEPEPVAPQTTTERPAVEPATVQVPGAARDLPPASRGTTQR
jgi:Mrp family chromosome partitioning ATPase/capsular polysaccharide biosynthesis protein